MCTNLYQKIFKPLFLAIAVLAPLTSFCWGVIGHRVVAEIAQHHLTHKAKKELRKIFGKETLAQWANWPDFIKSDTTNTWSHASKWHYVDLPANLTKEEFISDLKKLPGENLYTQIQAMMKQVADHSLSIEQRQIALRFLIHLIGDLHQPLHVGRDEDQGGNKIKVFWFDRPTNLHSVWDNALVDFQQYSYTEYAGILDIAGKDQIKEWQDSSLEDWFYDSYLLANKIYALTPPDAKLSYRYNYLFKNDLDNQLLKGGLRLAKVLNEVLR
ncbi:MAG: S1/P1 nuclease [Bacteroidetes bacterium]|nr:S1/P1 nuclease [Bacteroidota bacterium]MBS1633787.1 S1/P1 nuclease [Bacteroidota bacterium]